MRQETWEQAADSITIRAALLGAVAGAGVTYSTVSSYPQLPLFLAFLSIFHILEFWVTAAYNPGKATIDSTYGNDLQALMTEFILSNGKGYQIAHASAVLEALIEYYCWPWAKHSWRLSIVGLVFIIFGQATRTVAMATAGPNFSHQVALRHEQDHRLVREGVYGFVRHPSYCGFFYWAIGTQIFLLNPFSAVAFTVVLWRFFKDRITKEESLLLSFFHGDYVLYMQQTPSGLPFV